MSIITIIAQDEISKEKSTKAVDEGSKDNKDNDKSKGGESKDKKNSC